MQQRLTSLVQQVHAARTRRPATGEAGSRLDEVLAVLQADHADHGRPPEDGRDRLDDVRRVFALSPLDVDLLAVACAPDLDPNLGLAFSLLQGDPLRVRPGLGLAFELCEAPLLSPAARSRVGPAGPLRRHGLLQLSGEEPVLQRALRVPDRVVSHLLGDDTLEPVLTAMAVQVVPAPLPEAVAVACAVESGVPLVWVRARPGTAGLGLATAALDQLDISHLAFDLARRPADTSLEATVRTATREAGLQWAGLVLLGADALAEPENVWLLEFLERAPVPVVAVAQRGWDPSWLRDLPLVVDAPATTAQVRDELWRQVLGPKVEADGPGWRELISLRLTPEEIAQTGQYAAVLATSRQEATSVTTAREAARRLSADMSGARVGRSAPTFDDLVLPPPVLTTLKELVGWARHRDEVLGQGPLAGKGDKGRGIAALFSGSPGTGKTLAAHVVAAELGLDLHTVELSSIVDKYIGETEKNLERVFNEAESLNVLLFFDEADALFGARSEVRDARDRYANQEVAYLLQRMEQFDGIAVLATNLRGNLDVAFSRRLHFIVHFPDPDEATRRQLWQSHVDAVASLDPEDPVDVDHLAETVEVAGGDIRNVVLAAAYAAVAEGVPLGMRHVVRAVVREYRKLGRRLPVPGLVTVD